MEPEAEHHLHTASEKMFNFDRVTGAFDEFIGETSRRFLHGNQ
jgi:hypothetical protein